MKRFNTLTKKTVSLLIAGIISTGCIYNNVNDIAIVEAASYSEDIDGQITDLEKNLEILNKKKMKQEAELNKEKINSLEKSIENINKSLATQNKYDAKGAIESLAGQLNEIKKQFAQQQDINKSILDALKKLQEPSSFSHKNTFKGNDDSYIDTYSSGYRNEEEKYLYNEYSDNPRAAGINTSAYLVNPAPARNVSFTQDAINAQGTSTMVFQYSPNQLYKVYCRVGYLTDIALKDGETITFVGGGDTAAWMLDTSIVGTTPHLYVKPIAKDVNTNIVVNTTEHTYQLILNSSDWYNPMVRWNYGIENNINMKKQKKKDEKIIIGETNAYSVDKLNFEYTVSGNQSWKPVMVFDDGQKTYIKFKKLKSTMPVLFIREKNKKSVSMVNYKVKDDCYIVDKLFDEAQLRMNDKDIVTITADAD